MDKFYEGLAEILEIAVSEIKPELNLADYPWDSLAVVSTIALADDCFGLLLEGQALMQCATVFDVEKLIRAKQGCA